MIPEPRTMRDEHMDQLAHGMSLTIEQLRAERDSLLTEREELREALAEISNTDTGERCRKLARSVLSSRETTDEPYMEPGVIEAAIEANGRETTDSPPRNVETSDERRAPVQGGRERKDGTIAWSEHEAVWELYRAQYGDDQTAERIAERGGFGYAEIIRLTGAEPKTFHSTSPPTDGTDRREGDER